MRSPSREEGLAIAQTMNEPFNFEHASRPLTTVTSFDLQARQVAFVARRCGLDADRARLVATLAFGGAN